MRLSNNTTSINSIVAAFVVTLSVGSCKMDSVDHDARRVKLGDIQIALASSLPNRSDVTFEGRVINFSDSPSTLPGFGTFAHYITIRDSGSTADSVRIYYSIPSGAFLNAANLLADTSMRVIMIFKAVQSRVALLLKDKRDSLLCMMGTLLPTELDSVLAKSGAQRIRVTAGNEVFFTRNTDCGREGDFNMIFADRNGSISVKPAQTAVFASGARSYLVANVANSYLIKNLKACPETAGEFSFFILRQ